MDFLLYGLGRQSKRLWFSGREEQLCRKEMATKPGLAGNGSASFFCGSALANCERRWKPNNKRRVSVKDEPASGG